MPLSTRQKGQALIVVGLAALAAMGLCLRFHFDAGAGFGLGLGLTTLVFGLRSLHRPRPA